MAYAGSLAGCAIEEIVKSKKTSLAINSALRKKIVPFPPLNVVITLPAP